MQGVEDNYDGYCTETYIWKQHKQSIVKRNTLTPTSTQSKKLKTADDNGRYANRNNCMVV